MYLGAKQSKALQFSPVPHMVRSARLNVRLSFLSYLDESECKNIRKGMHKTNIWDSLLEARDVDIGIIMTNLYTLFLT